MKNKMFKLRRLDRFGIIYFLLPRDAELSKKKKRSHLFKRECILKNQENISMKYSDIWLQ